MDIEELSINSTSSVPKDMDNLSWAEKYKPKHIKDIKGNVYQVNAISKWLDNYDKNKKEQLTNPKRKKKIKIDIKVLEEIDENDGDDADADAEVLVESEPEEIIVGKKGNVDGECSCMIILGDHGVGKTCNVLAILNDMKYDTQVVNLSKIGLTKNVNEYVKKIMKGTNIYNRILGNVERKSAIVIDEIEAITSPAEKQFIVAVLKLNEKNWHCPVIFISNNKHNKIISTLKQNSKNIYFNQPIDESLWYTVMEVCTKENMCLENEQVVKKIMEHSQRDFRRLLFVLQDLKTLYKTDITLDIMAEYCALSKKKDTDIDIFKATASMMVNYQGIDECIRLYEGEKVIIPLMMHQNYIDYITPYAKKDSSFELVTNIAKSIAKGDVIENYIYSDQNWDMQEVHGFFTCVAPSFKLSDQKYGVVEERVRRIVKFPHDLNRTSIKKINKKNVVNSNNCLKNFEIGDFICANKLIKQMIADDRIGECAGLFKDYGAKVENIESILKIEKINETKTSLPTQVKKKFSQILGTNKQPAQKKSKSSKITKIQK